MTKDKCHKILLIFTLMLFLCISMMSTAGTVEYRQYDLDSSPKDLVWCGQNNDTVMVLTELNSVYKSEDKGFSWKKMNDIFTNTGKDQLEENENEVLIFIKDCPSLLFG